jgi:hypothetical protein
MARPAALVLAQTKQTTTSTTALREAPWLVLVVLYSYSILGANLLIVIGLSSFGVFWRRNTPLTEEEYSFDRGGILLARGGILL